MPGINQLAVRLYRRFFTAPHVYDGSAEANAVLDGNSAVALTEAMIVEGVVLGGGFPANGAEIALQQRLESEVFSAHSTEGPRGALAAAMGHSLAGRRTTLFLSGSDLASAQDLLANAAGRHLPLVIHLANRALPTQSDSLGDDQQALRLSAESGCFVLYATNVQEAVDLTLIARWVAERALVPGVVVMDGARTALAPQELRLPTLEMVQGFLGRADDQITSPTKSQKILFGENRRRVPKGYDLDQPMLQAPVQSAEAYALGSAAGDIYFDRHLGELLDLARDKFGELSGRRYSQISHYRLDDSDLVLVAQGAAVETARAVAEYLRRKRKFKVGVLGLRTLRPLPGPALLESIIGKRTVAVLESSTTPLAGDSPLMREVRSSLNLAADNGHYGESCHPGYPSMMTRERPRLHSLIYGLGGMPLCGSDLAELCRELPTQLPSRRYLGINFHNSNNAHPKRQVLLDRIRRAYPEIDALGFSTNKRQDLRQEDAFTLSLHTPADHANDALIGEAGAVLRQLAKGQIRVIPDLSRSDFAGWGESRLHWTSGLAGDLGDDTPVDFAMALGRGGSFDPDIHRDLCKGGGLLLVGGNGDGTLSGLGMESKEFIKRQEITCYQLPEWKAGQTSHPALDQGVSPEELRDAYLMGGLFAALQMHDQMDASARKQLAAMELGLAGLEESERSQLAELFEQGQNALVELSEDQAEATAHNPEGERVPQVVRQLGGSSETLESLPRFWDQVGVLYRNDEQQELTADPFMAAAAIPPLSATFRDLSEVRDGLPQFDADACSGCGNCWSACPDSAIGVTALNPKALLDMGIQLTAGDALRPMAGKLAARISAMGRAGDLTGGTASQWLEQAWAWLQEKAPLPEDRLATMQQAMDKMLAAVGPLPLSVTDPLFHQGEKHNKDSGDLLALVINPDSCKGCGLCISSCPDEALSYQHQVDQGARANWQLWGETPDSPSATIERMVSDEAMDPMAAIMLSRYCSLAMAGGDGAEAGAGDKIALRMVLAATEYQQQPLLHRFSQQLDEVHESLNHQIRETLTEALPTDDLPALAENLDASTDQQVSLSDLVTRVSGDAGIDSQRLSRLIKLAQGLKDTCWRLTRGPQGLGRARFGLAVIGHPAHWAGSFPNNPFQVPVTLDATGNGPQLAAGLLQGQLDGAIKSINLLRQAQHELDPRSNGELLADLTWEALDHDQRQLCPPLLLLGDEHELGGRGFAQLAWLLKSDLPIKIIVTSDLDMGLDCRRLKGQPLDTSVNPRGDLALMALAQRGAYVAQCSIADGGHLRQSLRQALTFGGPALVRIHAPAPGRHGFAPERTLEQASLALSSRAFPLFSYHPEDEGVFGSRISLAGNHDLSSRWPDSGLNPLAWMATEGRFSSHFGLLRDSDPAPIDAMEWLGLDEKARLKKSPVYILEPQEEGVEIKRYRVSEAMMLQVDKLGDAWQLLQEIAGVVTPFTDRVRQEAEAAVADAHQQALAAQQVALVGEMVTNRDQLQSELAGEIRSRLLGLAGYGG
ncbi:MAG: pyruvate ferredoxin oxidoreductase [Gammaproteobacteria bacterium]|nr:pyruvate ferredoxin oxidoreductase [Gammaproteobacteria bacterium]